MCPRALQIIDPPFSLNLYIRTERFLELIRVNHGGEVISTIQSLVSLRALPDNIHLALRRYINCILYHEQRR